MGDTLAVVSLVVALVTPSAGSPVPVASPASSAAPLKEIVRVRVTTPFCRSLLANAADAVAIETDNDRKLDGAIDSLHTLDFDANDLVKFRNTRDLTRQFVSLRASAVSGIGIMKQFRESAQGSADDGRRKALTSFGDSVAGALHRQKVLADDIGRFIAFLDAHEPITTEEHDKMVFDAAFAQNASNQFSSGDPRDNVPPQLSTIAKDASGELARRAVPLKTDEDVAASRIDAAFAGC